VRGGHGRVPDAGPGALGCGSRSGRRVRPRVRCALPRRGASVSEATAAATPLDIGAPVIEVEHIEVNFKGRVGLLAGRAARTRVDAKAVDYRSLAKQEGEAHALTGEPGCGKTTPARAIMGLIAPGKGTIRFKGKDLPRSTTGLRPYRRQVQMV